MAETREAKTAKSKNDPLSPLIKRLEKLDTSDMTALDIAEHLGAPVHQVYAALLKVGRTVANGAYRAAIGYPAGEPLHEQIAQIDTSDMTVDQVAERFNVTPHRARSALTVLGRFAKQGGYRPKPRAPRKKTSGEKTTGEKKPPTTRSRR